MISIWKEHLINLLAHSSSLVTLKFNQKKLMRYIYIYIYISSVTLVLLELLKCFLLNLFIYFYFHEN